MTHKCIENVSKWENITEQLLNKNRLATMRRAVLITQSQLCFQYEEVAEEEVAEEEPKTMEPETAAEKEEFYRLLSIGAWPSDA